MIRLASFVAVDSEAGFGEEEETGAETSGDFSGGGVEDYEFE